MMKTLSLRVLLLAAFPFAYLLAHAQDEPEAAPSPTPATTWPRSFANDDVAITVYQPQILSWKDNLITMRAAVSALSAGVAAPVFGTITLSARTEVDKEAGLVDFMDLHVTGTNFPTAASEAGSYADLIITQAQRWSQNISLARLTADLAVTQAESASSATPDLQNTPPHIIFSSVPAALVLVDGQPALRPVAGSSLLRVINTAALLLMDQSSGNYYLRIAGTWATATALDSPWTQAANPPATLDAALQAATTARNVELFNSPSDNDDHATPPVIPAIYVSTTPAELVTTDGPPAFDPVSGTQLLAVKNSTSSLFLDVTNQNYFVVISGRWFTSNSLQGPWQFVSATQLPADFKNIPENAPAGAVLSAVAGTPQASEAVITNSIPQTATVKRSTATLDVKYEGDPQFNPISGTELAYGFNTQTPVIKVSPDQYYAVDNGVWFTGPSALGPWAVAEAVPPAIYTIPASCPVYYATHVYVYGYTPNVVYVGYTPGYFGTFVAPGGVVVYGSGYVYPPYIGPSAWYGPPVTYGFGAGFACGLATGFAFSLATDHGWGCSPWWGPYRGGWGNYNGNWNKNVTINRNYSTTNINNTNVYNRWGNSVVNNSRHPTVTNTDNHVDNTRIDNHIHPTTKTDAETRTAEERAAEQTRPDNVSRETLQHDNAMLKDNNVFAGSDGHTYKAAAKSDDWQTHDSSGWKNASNLDEHTKQDLNNQRYSRNLATTRENHSHPPEANHSVERESHPEEHESHGGGGGRHK